jgi:hypothetical protein
MSAITRGTGGRQLGQVAAVLVVPAGELHVIEDHPDLRGANQIQRMVMPRQLLKG